MKRTRQVKMALDDMSRRYFVVSADVTPLVPVESKGEWWYQKENGGINDAS